MSEIFFEKESQSPLSQDALFLHGNLASLGWWDLVRAELKNAPALKNHALIFSDARGSGKNPALGLKESFSLKDLAGDQLRLIERLQEQGVLKTPLFLVGHSLGGLIALQMMIEKPEYFSKALLLDPVGAKGVVFDDSMYEAFRQMAESFDLTRTVILSTIQNQDHVNDEMKNRIAEDAFKAVKGIGTSVLEILKTVDLESEIKTLQIPVLVLHGQQDAVIPLDDAKHLVQLLPQGRLEILPEAGHCWNVENPQDFTRRLKEFFHG